MFKSKCSQMFFLVLLFFLSPQLKCQSLEMELVYDLELSKNGQKDILISLDVNDEVQLEVTSSSLTNLLIVDPTSQTLNEVNTKKITSNWTHVSKVAGIYKLSVKNMSRFKEATISMILIVTKQNPLLHFPCRDSVEFEQKESILSRGEVAISKGKDKSYSFNVLRGDLFKFNLTPKSKKSPYVEIIHSNGETLFLSIPVKNSIDLSIPIVGDGSITINLKSKSYLNTLHDLCTSVKSLEKYYPCVEVAEVEAPPVVTIPFDTVPLLLLDTTIFLGATRDPVNKSEGEINLDISDKEILGWSILFGAGEKFKDQMDYFEKNLEGEPLEKGIADLLSAYSVGLIDKLPTYLPGKTKIEVPTLTRQNFSKIHPNYAILKGAPGKQKVQFSNESGSSGQKVYIYIVILRKQPFEK